MLFLYVSGFDADPNEVTDILQLSPTWVARKGDELGKGRHRKTNHWRLSVCSDQLESAADHKDGLVSLTRLLSGKETAFAKLRTQLKPHSIEIWGDLKVTHEQSKIWLDPLSMGLLAGCGITWGLDLHPTS